MVDQLEQQVVREKARLVAMVEHLKQSEAEHRIYKESFVEVFVQKSRLSFSCESEHSSEHSSKMGRTELPTKTVKSHQNTEDIRPPYTYAVLIREVSFLWFLSSG